MASCPGRQRRHACRHASQSRQRTGGGLQLQSACRLLHFCPCGPLQRSDAAVRQPRPLRPGRQLAAVATRSAQRRRRKLAQDRTSARCRERSRLCRCAPQLPARGGAQIHQWDAMAAGHIPQVRPPAAGPAVCDGLRARRDQYDDQRRSCRRRNAGPLVPRAGLNRSSVLEDQRRPVLRPACERQRRAGQHLSHDPPTPAPAEQATAQVRPARSACPSSGRTRSPTPGPAQELERCRAEGQRRPGRSGTRKAGVSPAVRARTHGRGDDGGSGIHLKAVPVPGQPSCTGQFADLVLQEARLKDPVEHVFHRTGLILCAGLFQGAGLILHARGALPGLGVVRVRRRLRRGSP